jgi:transposase
MMKRGGCMYLKQDKRPNGRIYLSVVKGFRDPVTKKNKQKAIKSIGFLDEFIDEYDDPIAHFKQVAKQMTEEENKNKEIELILDMTEKLDTNSNDMKNIGFSVLSKIYHILGIHKFMINRERGLKADIPLNNILKLLVYERILNPCSKLAAHENKENYFENFDFPLKSIYRALPIFAKYKDKLLLELHENITMKYGRDTSNVYYDVTNYYFHKDQQTELIRKGMGKDKKGKPIIQMGLLMDKAGLPITYKLFSGNTTDFETLLPILSELKTNYNLNRVIVVADKGLNSGTNKAYNIIKGDGYIFSRSIRGTKASKEIKDYVLDDEGYEWIGEDFKIKSRIYPTVITVKNAEGKDVKVDLDEKHVVFFSKKYAERSRHKRNEAIAKALKLVDSPSRYAKAGSYGSMKYVVGMKLDKKTGELTQARKDILPRLNDDLIKEEEKYDGYYSIVTSELYMSDSEIIEKYRGLWKIEETFKVTKSQLQTRPAYVWSEGGIEGHFLTCFLSLLILRILEMETKGTYSTEKLIDSLAKSNVDHLKMNYYKGMYYDEVLKCIDENLGTKLKQKYQTLDGIKKMISDTKQAL